MEVLNNGSNKRTISPYVCTTGETITAANNQTISTIIAFSFIAIICNIFSIRNSNANRSHSHTSKTSEECELNVCVKHCIELDIE